MRGSSSEASSVSPGQCLARSAGSLAQASECPASTLGRPASSPGSWAVRGSSSEASSVSPSLCLARSAGPLSETGLPGAALSCSYLASLRACLPGAPAPSEPRWTLHVVEAAQPPPPPCGGPRSCADPRGVASGCCYRLRVLMSPRAHHAGTPAPSEPRWTLPVVEVDRSPLLAQAFEGPASIPPGHPPESTLASLGERQAHSWRPQISPVTEPACTPRRPPCPQLSSGWMG